MTQHRPQELDEILAALRRLRQERCAIINDETGATDTVELDQAAQGRVSRIDAIQQQKMALSEWQVISFQSDNHQKNIHNASE